MFIRKDEFVSQTETPSTQGSTEQYMQPPMQQSEQPYIEQPIQQKTDRSHVVL